MMKKHLWAVCFAVVLIAFTSFIALDTFVLAASYNTNATEMNTSMFAESTADRSALNADENNEASASAEAQQNDGSSAASAEISQPQQSGADAVQAGNSSDESTSSDGGNSAAQSGDSSGETDSDVDSTSGASESQSSDASGEMSGWGWGGWGGRGSGSGEMSRSGSNRSSDSGDSTDSSNSTDSSSRSSTRSGRGWGGNSEWESSSGWGGGWGGNSGWGGGGWSGRSSMSSAKSADGVDASAEYSGDTTYKDDNVTITLTEYNQNDTRIYVADVTVTSTQYIKAAFANDTYGKNVTESTSAMAVAHNAILAVNGDYYGAQERGFVIRNGIVYRSTSAGKDVLCIYADGTMGIVSDRETTADELVANGVWQAFSFGPVLIEDGAVSVSQYDEVGMGMISNPRTAVGMIDTNHFVFVVSDGRTGESEGLSLYDLAQFMKSLGVKTAYNLDGGGSSTMYFNGQIVNNPTSWGGSISERGVSDIVYIG